MPSSPILQACSNTTSPGWVRWALRRRSRLNFLFVPFPHQSADSHLARIQHARHPCCVDQELVALEPVLTLLLRAIPGFVPGYVDSGDEHVAFNAILSTVGKHCL